MTTSDVQRLGNLHKCPACGSEVDEEAYYCPKCRNFFCYRCRALVRASGEQFLCANPECDYHSKVVCVGCDPDVQKDEPPSVYFVREGGWWPNLLVGALVVAGVAWYYASFWVAVLIAAVVLAICAFLLHRFGVNVFGKNVRIEEPNVILHHACIRCKQPVRKLA